MDRLSLARSLDGVRDPRLSRQRDQIREIFLWAGPRAGMMAEHAQASLAPMEWDTMISPAPCEAS